MDGFKDGDGRLVPAFWRTGILKKKEEPGGVFGIPPIVSVVRWSLLLQLFVPSIGAGAMRCIFQEHYVLL